MSVNPGAAEHPHRQIAASLRERIRNGEWAPGERIPSIPALAEGYAVAKQTVQRTIDQLRVEGLLITRPGSGTYVRGTRRRLSRLSRTAKRREPTMMKGSRNGRNSQKRAPAFAGFCTAWGWRARSGWACSSS